MSESRANMLTKELAALDKTMADLRKKEGDLSKKQAQLTVAIASAKSTSTLSTKTRELERALKDLAGVHEKLSSTLKRRADKEAELVRVRASVQVAREKELKRIATFEEKQRRVVLIRFGGHPEEGVLDVYKHGREAQEVEASAADVHA
ncbi:MAG: hypothetical protein ACT4TC_16360 [Myxococcaceae bacterium]